MSVMLPEKKPDKPLEVSRPQPARPDLSPDEKKQGRQARVAASLQSDGGTSDGPKAVSGIAVPTTKVTTKVGASKSSEHELSKSGAGGALTHTQSSETTAQVGASVKSEYSHVVTDGTTKTTNERQASAVVGVEASIKRLESFSDQDRAKGREVMARAGAFGEVEQKNAVQRGLAKADLTVKGSAGAGVEAKLVAQARANRSGVVGAYYAAVEAGVKAGLWGDASVTAGVELSSQLRAELELKLSFLFGAEAKFAGSVFANLRDGVGFDFSGEARAGAFAEGTVTGRVTLAGAEIEAALEGKLMAGAIASGKGNFRIGLTGVAASFEAEAKAGAGASAKGSTTFKIRGRKIASASGEVEVFAGAEAKVKFPFVISGSEVKLGVGGAMALGVGGGASVELELNPKAIAEAIYIEVVEMSKSSTDPTITGKSPDYVREPLTDKAEKLAKTQSGYNAVREGLQKYADKKAVQGKGVKSRGQAVLDGAPAKNDEYIKQAKVQTILNTMLPTVGSDIAYSEVDRGVEQAILEAFKGYVTGVVTQQGQIRDWKVVENRDDAVAARSRAGLAVRTTELEKELASYCLEAYKKKGGISIATLQKKVLAFYPKLLQTATDPDGKARMRDADSAVAAALTNVATLYLEGSLDVNAGGFAPDLKVSEGKVARAKNADAKQVATGKLRVSLQKMLATSVKRGDLDFSDAELQKAVDAGVKDISGQLRAPAPDAPEADREAATAARDEVQAAVLESLGEAVRSVDIDPTGKVKVRAEAGGVAKVRAAQRQDAQVAKRQVAIKTFSASLATYFDQKLSEGEHQIKPAKVQKMADEVLKAGKWAHWEMADLDGRLAAAIKEVLEPVMDGGDAVVSGGVVKALAVDANKFATFKTMRKANGKSTVDQGAGGDNARRMIVADALRDPLIRLENELRMANLMVENGLFRSAPERNLTDALLNKRVKQALAGVKADAVSVAGQGQVAASILEYLPMVESLSVSPDLQVKAVVTADFYAAAIEDGAKMFDARQLLADATKQVERGLRTLVKGKEIESLTAEMLKPMVAKQHAALVTGGLSAETADVQLTGVVRTAISQLGSPLATVEIENGQLNTLVLSSLKKKSR